MSEDLNVFSLISSTVSEEPALKSSIDYLTNVRKQEEEYVKVHAEIKTLFAQCNSNNIPSSNNFLIDDIVKNITDGRFKELLNKKPDIYPMDDKSLQETVERVESIIVELDELNSKVKGITPIPDISKSTRDSILKFDSDVKTRTNVEKCINSLKRLQSNFQNFEVNDKLLNSSLRDLAFENNIRRLIKQIGDINKFIDSRRTITRLYKKKNRETKSTPVASALFAAISELLEEVESVNYVPED